jgi:hypothetical protein
VLYNLGAAGLDSPVKKKLLEVFGGGGKGHGAISMAPSRFAVYVPSRLEDKTEIPKKRYDELVKISREFLFQKLGGLTSYNAKGYWRGKDLSLHEEDTLVMESFCEITKLLDAAYALRQFANALAIEFQQESMACVVDGEMVFFNPAKEYRKQHKEFVLVPSKRKLDSVTWKHVLAPLKEAGVESVYGSIV